MKKSVKYIAAGLGAVLVVAAIAFGPTFLDLHRLQGFIAETTDAEVADAGPWPRATDACTLCHGVQGKSANQNYPSLAGQPAPYIVAQLEAYAGGTRHNPTMGPLAMNMTPAEIKSYADYYARQVPAENEYYKPDAGLAAKGEQLVKAGACASCHGEGLTGQDQFPRLAGQGFDYLVRQLDGFAEGRRIDPTGTMATVAGGMTAPDRKAVAAYLAAMPSK